jgi:hypothetical protein
VFRLQESSGKSQLRQVSLNGREAMGHHDAHSAEQSLLRPEEQRPTKPTAQTSFNLLNF